MDDLRADLMAHLSAKGVSSGVHYIPNHLHKAFEPFATPLPATERLFSQILTLPFHAALTDTEVEQVIDAVLRFEVTGVGR